jgi:hypothetical protein
MEVLSFSITSVLIRATWRNIPEDGILHSHLRENLKSFMNTCSSEGAEDNHGEIICRGRSRGRIFQHKTFIMRSSDINNRRETLLNVSCLRLICVHVDSQLLSCSSASIMQGVEQFGVTQARLLQHCCLRHSRARIRAPIGCDVTVTQLSCIG